MLKKASTSTLPQRRRGTRTEPPESFDTASMPSAENGSVSARKVSGAYSATPSFSTGQLQPQTSVSTSTGISAAAVMCGWLAAAECCFTRRGGMLEVRDAAARKPRRSSHPRSRASGSAPYLLRCSARACVTQPSRRMRPGNSCSRGVEFVDVAFGPARDLPVGRDAQLIEHPFEHRSDADDQLEVIRRAGTAQAAAAARRSRGR